MRIKSRLPKACNMLTPAQLRLIKVNAFGVTLY